MSDYEKREHEELCFRFKILCECPECIPPACICALIRAIKAEDKQAIRIAYWDSVKSEQSWQEIRDGRP